MRGLLARLCALAILLALVGLGGCRVDEPDPEIIITRIELQESIPGGVYERDRVHPFDPSGGSYPDDLTLLFNRTVAVSELNIRFFPEPVSYTGITASLTAGIVRIKDYVPIAGLSVQRLLIDSPKAEEPYLLAFYAGEPVQGAGYVFCRAFTRDPNPPTLHALCFAYSAEQLVGVTNPRAVLDIEPFSVAIAYHGVAGETNRSTHRAALAELPGGTLYTVAAIYDLDGNGVYDPEVDWWAVSTDSNSSSSWLPEWRTPAALLEAEVIDIELHAPR